MKVYKRNGQEVDFALDKIKGAIDKANRSTFKKFESEIESECFPNDDDLLTYDQILVVTEDDFDWDNPDNWKTINKPLTTKDKLIKGLTKYILVDGTLNKAIEQTQKFLKPFDTVTVEDISDLVEKALMKVNAFEVAKEFITYRENKKKNKKFTDTEEKVLAVIDGTNEELRGDNANKHIDINSSARDYIAGTVCKSIADKILPSDIAKAHKEGYIHWHDKDYSPVQHMTNCCLLNTEDMLVNGFQMGDAHIDRPRRVSTAGNLMSQIALITSGQQYGGQTSTIAAMLPIIKTTRICCAQDYASELLGKDYKYFSKYQSYDEIYKAYKKESSPFKRVSKKKFFDEVERKVRHDIHIGIKTYAWQILCHHSSNGQSPFTSLVLNLREAEDEQEQKDLAILIEEVIDRRIKGVTGSHGENITPLFPKLLYWTCDGLNVNPGDPYYYLTKKAAKCITIRMAPDINSEKMSRKIKQGQVIPSMGAARGDETVSIKIDDIEYNNISIAEAYIKLRDSNKIKQDFKIKTDKTGVYKITHIPTGKYYIGSSKNIGKRLNEHDTSISRKGSLGDNYYIGDFDRDNYKEEILEECSIDDLLTTEFKYIDLNDENCVNRKVPGKNGNFNSVNCKLTTSRQKYSTYENKWYTWVKEVDGTRCFIKRKGEWTPIRKITYNDPNNCNLKLFEISYEKNGGVKKLYITEDHPLRTQKGRTKAIDINSGDVIYDALTFEEYKIIGKREVNNNVPTYDFEVDNDMFDLSGILSYNCRSWLTPLWIEKTYPVNTKFHWQYINENNVQYEGAYGKNFDYSRGFGTYSELPRSADEKQSVAINFRGNTGWIKDIETDEKGNELVRIIEPKVYGRWNNGVVTLNISMYAGEARLRVNKLLGEDTTNFIDLQEESIDEFN